MTVTGARRWGLAAGQRHPELDRNMRRGGWNRTGPYAPRQLSGSTVGLIGCGTIGALVADRLRGFGVELLIHDPALGDASLRSRSCCGTARSSRSTVPCCRTRGT
jgi:phosphoglycerate dehydrogenase-like enzyme